jgi:hypothetical protein
MEPVTEGRLCIECDAPAVLGVRCKSCQKRHNDLLRAEHEVMVRAMFRAGDGHGFGHSTRSARRVPAPDRSATSVERSPTRSKIDHGRPAMPAASRRVGRPALW